MHSGYFCVQQLMFRMKKSIFPGLAVCVAVLAGLACTLHAASAHGMSSHHAASSETEVAQYDSHITSSETDAPQPGASAKEEESEASQRVVQSRHTSRRAIRWYIGSTLGPAIPVGDYGDKSRSVTFRAHPRGSYTGMQIRLINLGVFFTDRIGVTATVLGGANPVDLGGSNRWSYSGALIGPLISLPITHNVDWDVRPMVGYAVHTEDTIDEYPTSMAINLGSTFRLKITDSFSLLAGLDYYLSNASFENPRFSQPMGTVSLDMGVAYTFR